MRDGVGDSHTQQNKRFIFTANQPIGCSRLSVNISSEDSVSTILLLFPGRTITAFIDNNGRLRTVVFDGGGNGLADPV